MHALLLLAFARAFTLMDAHLSASPHSSFLSLCSWATLLASLTWSLCLNPCLDLRPYMLQSWLTCTVWRLQWVLLKPPPHFCHQSNHLCARRGPSLQGLALTARVKISPSYDPLCNIGRCTHSGNLESFVARKSRY